MTYSIVARDPETGEMGVAVQSHYFTVGPIVPWLRAGVGAVATQSFVEPAYGLRGLARMAAGERRAGRRSRRWSPTTRRATCGRWRWSTPPGGSARTPARSCIADAGHRVGDGLLGAGQHDAQPDACPTRCSTPTSSTDAPLAERLVAALVAAEGEGGDIRGRQSAAIKIVRGASGDDPWNDVVLDLRVDDHPDPNTELARLVRMHRAYAKLGRSEALRVEQKTAEADAEAEAALALLPESIELGFWHGVQLCIDGRDAEARPLLDRAYAVDDGWRELVRRLPGGRAAGRRCGAVRASSEMAPPEHRRGRRVPAWRRIVRVDATPVRCRAHRRPHWRAVRVRARASVHSRARADRRRHRASGAIPAKRGSARHRHAILVALDQHDRLRRRALAAAREAEAVRRRAADRDPVGRRAHRLGDAAAHLVDVAARSSAPAAPPRSRRSRAASPRPPPASQTRASRSIEAASRHSSVFGNSRPMSPSAVAPSTASHSTWQTMSASEWPSSPRSAGTSTPPSTSRRPGHQPVGVERRADALLSQAAPPRARARGTAPATCSRPRRAEPQAAVEPDADVVRQVRVRRQRDRDAGRAQLREPDRPTGTPRRPPSAARRSRSRRTRRPRGTPRPPGRRARAPGLLGRPVAEHLREVGMGHHVVDARCTAAAHSAST